MLLYYRLHSRKHCLRVLKKHNRVDHIQGYELLTEHEFDANLFSRPHGTRRWWRYVDCPDYHLRLGELA